MAATKKQAKPAEKAPAASAKGEKPKTTPAVASQGHVPAPAKAASKPVDTTEDKIMQHVKLHGKEFVGTVISDKAHKTVTVEWERRRLVSKYERYERRYSRVYAHNPIAIGAKLGDVVRVKETRPLSKTKHFVVVEILTGAAQ